MERLSLKHLLAPLIGAVLLTGCTINRDIMFKTPNDFVFDAYLDSAALEARIQPNDVLQFRLFANDGFKMIDLVSEGASQEARFLNRMVFTYTVEYDGMVKLPLLGRIAVTGMSTREAELFLESLYKEFYVRPFVQLQVVNRRVVVYPGGGGDARWIPLENNNTTLLEVLGMAGGLNRRGDARKVKLFRLDPSTNQRKVYQFDLSDITGLKYGDIVMQGDDVVYVQPNPELARQALYDLAPIVTLLTTVLLVISLTRSFN
ncbi:MAG: polysaccharide biosynthesis/export family protein [Flavobacteriales bacterium]|nr:polysaccharide biosynthesis/export family protein [Flavobacteriales bacterium]